MKQYLLLALLCVNISYANDEYWAGDCIKPTPEIAVGYQECLTKKGFARVGQMFQTAFGEFPYPLGLIDKTGKMILPLKYHDIDFPKDWEYDSSSEPSHALILVKQREINQDGLFGHFAETESYGVVNEKGEFIVPMDTYEQIGAFADELAMVNKSGKYGFIDTTGKIVIPMIYDYTNLFVHYGFVGVKKDKKFGIIDKQNNIIIPFDYDSAEVLSKNLFKVKKDDYYALINSNNQLLTNFEYESIRPIFYNDMSLVYKNRLYGLVNNQGKFILEMKYDYIDIDFEKTYANDEKKVYIKAIIGDKELSFDEFGQLLE